MRHRMEVKLTRTQNLNLTCIFPEVWQEELNTENKGSRHVKIRKHKLFFFAYREVMDLRDHERPPVRAEPEKDFLKKIETREIPRDLKRRQRLWRF